MKKTKMLEATEYNWDLMELGDWRTVTWIINHDMSYSITTEYLPECDPNSKDFIELWDPDSNDFSELVKKTENGVMDEAEFTELLEKLNTKLWRNPDIQINACDGSAWQITYYSSDGKVINSSGKLDYIYGEEVLENIVSRLPQTEEEHDANAFVYVTKKNADALK